MTLPNWSSSFIQHLECASVLTRWMCHYRCCSVRAPTYSSSYCCHWRQRSRSISAPDLFSGNVHQCRVLFEVAFGNLSIAVLCQPTQLCTNAARPTVQRFCLSRGNVSCCSHSYSNAKCFNKKILRSWPSIFVCVNAIHRFHTQLFSLSLQLQLAGAGSACGATIVCNGAAGTTHQRCVVWIIERNVWQRY